MSPSAIAWSAIATMGVAIGALYLVYVKINTPEPARADDETAEWMHRLVGPARVMADPVLSRLAVLGRAVADAARSRDTMACGCRPGGPSCQWWAGQLHPLNVSGPAAATVSPSTAGPEAPHPVTSAAGNHRPAAPGVTSLPPAHDHSAITDPWVCQACADEVEQYGWPEGEEPEPYEDDDEPVHLYQRADGSIVPADSVAVLPPVDQAAHLQPIDWADDTGSFLAACAGDYR